MVDSRGDLRLKCVDEAVYVEAASGFVANMSICGYSRLHTIGSILLHY